MNSEEPSQISVDAIVSEEAVAAGVGALERIHGHHLGEMSPQDQAEARTHWRRQVEEILTAVRGVYETPPPPGTGRAVVWYSDSRDGQVHVSASFQPELQRTGTGEFTGTPAQALAANAFSAAQSVSEPRATDDQA